MKHAFETVMRIIAILVLVICFIKLTSCNIIRNNVLKKYCKTDTVTITVHDTVRTETVKTDTVFHESVDSVTIFKDKLKIVYRKVHDSIYINGECEGDTIYISKTVQVPVKCVELTNWQIAQRLRFWLLIIFFAGFILGVYIKLR